MSDHHHADCPEGAACREIEAAVLQRDEELRAWDRLKADRDRLAAENERLTVRNAEQDRLIEDLYNTLDRVKARLKLLSSADPL